MSTLSKFVKERRKKLGVTQQELAERAGLGLRFVREVEQGKTTLKMDKVNQLLSMFGHELAPVESMRQKHTNGQTNYDQ